MEEGGYVWVMRIQCSPVRFVRAYVCNMCGTYLQNGKICIQTRLMSIYFSTIHRSLVCHYVSTKKRKKMLL